MKLLESGQKYEQKNYEKRSLECPVPKHKILFSNHVLGSSRARLVHTLDLAWRLGLSRATVTQQILGSTRTWLHHPNITECKAWSTLEYTIHVLHTSRCMF